MIYITNRLSRIETHFLWTVNCVHFHSLRRGHSPFFARHLCCIRIAHIYRYQFYLSKSLSQWNYRCLLNSKENVNNSVFMVSSWAIESNTESIVNQKENSTRVRDPCSFTFNRKHIAVGLGILIVESIVYSICSETSFEDCQHSHIHVKCSIFR